MTAIETKISAPTPDHREQRISIVTGDRLCTTCGYNMIGQTVLREPHYQLLIVRCPECGTAAGIQEYPLLGRWANRWGVILAALWFIILLGMLPATSAAIMGCGIGVGEEASHSYGRWLRNLEQTQQQQAQQQLVAQTPAAPGGSPPTPAQTTATAPASVVTTAPVVPPLPGLPNAAFNQRITTIITTGLGGGDFSQWWAQQDSQALFAQAGGWRGAVDWDAMFIWIGVTAMCIAFGWFWTIALLQFRRRWTFLWGAMIIGLSLLFGIVPYLMWTTDEVNYYWDAAHQQISPPLFLATIAFSIIPLAIGLAFGRQATRLLVRALLPPRLRGSLALLWTAEELALPKVQTR